MSWMSGSDVADELWETVAEYLPPEKKQEIARQWVEIFEGRDADMLSTIVGEDAGIETTEELGSHFAWKKP